EPHAQHVVDVREPVEPLDGNDARPEQHVAEERRVGPRRIEPVEVDVDERQAAAAVLRRDRERRAVDGFGICAEPTREAADEARLPRAELADEADDLATLSRAAERRAERLRLLGARGRELTCRHGSPARAAPRDATPSAVRRAPAAALR